MPGTTACVTWSVVQRCWSSIAAMSAGSSSRSACLRRSRRRGGGGRRPGRAPLRSPRGRPGGAAIAEVGHDRRPPVGAQSASVATLGVGPRRCRPGRGGHRRGEAARHDPPRPPVAPVMSTTRSVIGRTHGQSATPPRGRRASLRLRVVLGRRAGRCRPRCDGANRRIAPFALSADAGVRSTAPRPPAPGAGPRQEAARPVAPRPPDP